jgi:hypothetical protein
MKIFLLVVSVICFISAYGTHMFAKNNPMSWCGYMDVPFMAAIPWISGFLLAVIPEVILFNSINWVWILLGNAVIVFILGPVISRFFLVRFASGKGAGYDIMIALIIGGVTLGIALLI